MFKLSLYQYQELFVRNITHFQVNVDLVGEPYFNPNFPEKYIFIGYKALVSLNNSLFYQKICKDSSHKIEICWIDVYCHILYEKTKLYIIITARISRFLTPLAHMFNGHFGRGF